MNYKKQYYLDYHPIYKTFSKLNPYIALPNQLFDRRAKTHNATFSSWGLTINIKH